MKLFISPHNDDESLFGAFTIIREKPLVVIVTDSFIQPLRGDVGCSADERWAETKKATDIFNVAAFRGGLPDNELTEEGVRRLLQKFQGLEGVYAPAIQGGNWQHDLISKVASEVFVGTCPIRYYTTYTKTELWTKGTEEIIPTPEEKELKEKALWCYQSQINLRSTRPHFEAVIDKTEWLI